MYLKGLLKLLIFHRDTAQVSLGRGNSVLTANGEIFLFLFLNFEIFWDFEHLKKSSKIFIFFTFVKFVICDIIQKPQKNSVAL